MAEFNPEHINFNDFADKGEENYPMDDYTENNIEISGKVVTTLSNLHKVPETGSDIGEVETQKAVDEFYKSITYSTVFTKDPKTKQLYITCDNKNNNNLSTRQNPPKKNSCIRNNKTKN